MPTTTNGRDRKYIELGVLWSRVSKGADKQKFLTGTLNLKELGFDRDVPVVVFKNKQKVKDTHPDLRIYLSEDKSSGQKAPPKKEEPTTDAPTPPTSDDDVPF